MNANPLLNAIDAATAEARALRVDAMADGGPDVGRELAMVATKLDEAALWCGAAVVVAARADPHGRDPLALREARATAQLAELRGALGKVHELAYGAMNGDRPDPLDWVLNEIVHAIAGHLVPPHGTGD